MTVQEKVPFHCQRSHFSFLHFNYVQTEVNDAYYNLIVALLSCLWDCEITEKALESSDNASCCAEHYLLICTDITVSGKKQRDLVGSQWEGSMEEKRLEALAVRGNRRLLYAKHYKGRSFIFLFSLCPSLPLSSDSHKPLLSPFSTLCHPAYQSALFTFMLLLFLVWSLVLVELNSGKQNSSFFSIPPHIPLAECLCWYSASYFFCKTDGQTGFLASFSTLSQVKAHTPLERTEELETLDLLV